MVIYLIAIKINGENFGDADDVPIVTVNGTQCIGCTVLSPNGNSIFCQNCSSGVARSASVMAISVDSLVSLDFPFLYYGKILF